jgi:hypothetical protein
MKTKLILLPALVFILSCGFFAFCAWCSGFNFDHRSQQIGGNVLMIAFISALPAAAVAIHIHEQ